MHVRGDAGRGRRGGGGNGGTTPGITTGVDPAFYQGLDVAAAAANAQTATCAARAQSV